MSNRHPLKNLLNPVSDASAINTRRSIILIAGLSFVATVLEAMVLVLLAPVAQSLAAGDDVGARSIGPLDLTGSPAKLLWMTAGCAVASGFVRLAAIWAQVRLTTRWEHFQRDRLDAAFLDASWPVQQGERSARLSHWANYITRATNRLMFSSNAVRAAMSVAVLVLGAVVVQPIGAVLIVAMALLLFGCFRPLIRRTRAASIAAADAGRDVSDALEELVVDSRERHLFGSRDDAESTALRATARLMHLSQTSHLLSGAVAPIYTTTSLLMIVAILSLATSRRDLDVAATGATALLLLRSASYGQSFQDAYQRMVAAAPYGDLVTNAIAHYESGRITFGERKLTPITSVRLAGVGYRYDEDGDALSDIELELVTGQRVGVVGPSGSGKSTLSQILLRLRRPTIGVHLVNGIPADEIDTDNWVGQLALVPQDSRLIHGTVRENIVYHRSDLSDDDVRRAVRLAGLESVVDALPDGLHTAIGPTTRDLSGGQIQRIGIARALAGRPSLLVLDEPTSALDADSERLIHDTLASLGDEMIVVVIAHRPSTVDLCDRIIVLENGRIVADGTPVEVAGRNPYFRRMRHLRVVG